MSVDDAYTVQEITQQRQTSRRNRIDTDAEKVLQGLPGGRSTHAGNDLVCPCCQAGSGQCASAPARQLSPDARHQAGAVIEVVASQADQRARHVNWPAGRLVPQLHAPVSSSRHSALSFIVGSMVC